MTLKQRIFVLTMSVGLLLLIVDLVRRRKLREEYSWLWLLTGAVILVLGIWNGFLRVITKVTGIIEPTSIAFFFGITFLVLISIHYAVKISDLANKVKNLAQELAILESYIDELPQGNKQDHDKGRQGK